MPREFMLKLILIGIITTLAVVLGIRAAPAVAEDAGGMLVLSDSFSYRTGTWMEGGSYGPWSVRYHGYGSVGIEVDGTNTLYQQPQASTAAGETHAGLVLSTSFSGDLDLTLRAKTVRQLRTPIPNPWETAWVLWHYTDDYHFYYFALKTNGWELGKEDPAYPGAQRYLATGGFPSFSIGAWYAVRVHQVASTITVWVDGQEIVSFTDHERPYLSGAIGLYNEDAHVRFDDVRVMLLSPVADARPTPTTTPPPATPTPPSTALPTATPTPSSTPGRCTAWPC